MKRTLLALVVLLNIGRPLAAQTVGATNGAINGRVVDKTGLALPGVSVTIASPAMMGTRSDVTSDTGSFRFPAVAPGQYKVTFELAGFATVVRDGITVGLGFTATLNVELNVASLEENVTVSGVSPVVDTQATKVTATFTSEKLKSLPFTGEYWAMLSATPAVQMSSVDVGGSQALSPVGYTVYGMNTQHRPMVEGIVSTWGSGGSDMYYADFNSFSEVALNTAGNSAEAPSPGIQSNFISKSGGNTYHGSTFFEYESGNIQARNIDAAQLALRVTGGNGVDPVDTNRLLSYSKVSADLGGYLVKDKLWWYYAYSRLANEVRLVNVLGTTKTSKDPTNSAKVTYNPTKKISLIGYYQGTNKQVDPYLSGSQLLRVAQAPAIWQAGSPWSQHYPAGVWKGEYDHVLTNNLFLEVRGGNWWAHWSNYPYAATQYRYEDIGTNVISGGGRRYDDIRDRPQVLGSVSYFKDNWLGSHNFKLGGEILKETDDQFDGGFYNNTVMILRNGAPNQVYLFESPNNEQSGLWARSMYATDTWHAGRHLTFNLGLRYDRYQPFLDAQEHQAGPNNRTAISFAAVSSLLTWNNVAPRIGAVYDVTGKGKTVLKFNYGNYWWNPASDFAATLNPNQVLWWSLYSWNDLNNDGVFQPGEQGTRVQTNGGVASQRVDPALRNEYTTQVIGMLEQEVAPNFGVRAGFVWLGNRNLRTQVNQNQPYAAFNVPVSIPDPGPDGRVGTADDGPSIAGWNLAPQYVGLPTQNLTQNLPDAKDDFYTWELTGEKRMSHKWSLQASFATTWNRRSALATNPNMLINRIEGQDRFTSWQGKISGTFELPKGFRISPLLRHQAGTPFARTFAATLNYGSPTLQAELFDAERTRNVTILDLRVEKGIRVARGRVAAYFDAYNLFNANPETAVGTSSGATWLRPTTIVPPRIAKFGVKFDF